MTINGTTDTSHPTLRHEELYRQYKRQIFELTDRMFAILMPHCSGSPAWAALWLSPLTWSGTQPSLHPHVWLAFFSEQHVRPADNARIVMPGHTLTRYTVP